MAPGAPWAADPASAGRSIAVDAKPQGEVIWEGTSGGVTVRWTAADLSAARGAAAPGWSVASGLRRAFREQDAARSEERDAASNPCEQQSLVRLLSVVGPIVSLEQATITTCEREAHPAGETRYLALDLSRPAPEGESPRPVALTDYFPRAALFRALSQDALIRRALGPSGAAPRSLAELTEALAAAPPVLTEKLCFSVPADLLSRFAFHHLEGNRVAVRIGLPGAGPCRDNLTQLGLLLPVPASLSSALGAAAHRDQGFLMQDGEKIARGRETRIMLRSAPAAAR